MRLYFYYEFFGFLFHDLCCLSICYLDAIEGTFPLEDDASGCLFGIYPHVSDLYLQNHFFVILILCCIFVELS
jgi:hypothetical protein